MLRNQLRPAIAMTLLLCVLTGAIYPGIVTAIAQAVFARQANGSLVRVRGQVVGSALIGNWLLRTLSIGLPAFRIAGGLLLFSIASEMVFGVRIERQSRQAEDAIEEHVRNVAAFPLAIPLMAGPGAITATVLLAGRSEGDPMRLAILLAVIAFVAALCAAVFLLCTPIGRLLGVTGNIVLSRLLGVLLAALAVQYVVDGVRAALT